MKIDNITSYRNERLQLLTDQYHLAGDVKPKQTSDVFPPATKSIESTTNVFTEQFI